MCSRYLLHDTWRTAGRRLAVLMHYILYNQSFRWLLIISIITRPNIYLLFSVKLDGVLLLTIRLPPVERQLKSRYHFI